MGCRTPLGGRRRSAATAPEPRRCTPLAGLRRSLSAKLPVPGRASPNARPCDAPNSSEPGRRMPLAGLRRGTAATSPEPRRRTPLAGLRRSLAGKLPVFGRAGLRTPLRLLGRWNSPLSTRGSFVPSCVPSGVVVFWTTRVGLFSVWPGCWFCWPVRAWFARSGCLTLDRRSADLCATSARFCSSLVWRFSRISFDCGFSPTLPPTSLTVILGLLSPPLQQLLRPKLLNSL